jgi:hypothetical protein
MKVLYKLSRIFSFLFIVLFILVSCSNNEKKESSFTINGQIKYTSGMKIVLQELDLQDIKTLDSATIDPQGIFSFTYNPSDQGFYLLKLQDGRFITLLLNKGERVTITGDLKTFPRSYNITGSRGSELLKEFYEYTARNKAIGDSLMDVLHTHQYSSDYYKITISFDTLFQDIWHGQKTFEKNFIDKNRKSLSSLLVLNYAFGPRPVLSVDEDFSYYLKVDSSLMKLFPLNKHVIYHHKRIAEFQRQKQVKAIESENIKNN